MGVTVILRESKRGINVEEYMKWCHDKSLSIKMVRYLTDNWETEQNDIAFDFLNKKCALVFKLAHGGRIREYPRLFRKTRRTET
tara:strand:- start:140 stop:391 length:252 start_codon:yes stop_codon:yes gene_type:complete